MSRKQPFIWNALSVFRKAVCALPHEKAVALGGFLGGIVPYFTKKKFDLAVSRCSDVLCVSKEEASRIVAGAYKHFGRGAAEFARMPKAVSNINSLVRVHGEENLRNAYEKGRGVILATGHIGNWEYAAAWLANNGYLINALGTDQRDDRITKLIMDLRRAGGSKALGKASDLRAMLKALQDGEVIAVPIDQDARKKGILSPFLGRPASTPVGIAKLAAKVGCAVLPGFCIRSADGVTFDLYLLPQLEGRDGKNYGEDLQTSLDDCNAKISEYITKYPKQWMWMYPRWESVENGDFDDELRN
ncbi:MAG: lysophospholipid acyltransferase family protein [Synergistaceae bacterium]